MIQVFLSADGPTRDEYAAPLPRALQAAGLEAEIITVADDPAGVDYIVYAPGGATPDDFTPFTSCKAVLSLWAGVEKIVGNPTLTQPLCRMVDEGLTRGMVEWVTGHVLRHHLGMDQHILHQDGVWRAGSVPPLARDRRVTILGLGALGAACGEALANLGFPVIGWSRTQKDIAGLHCMAGEKGLQEALARADILVLLLPQTPETTHVLNDRTLALLPDGAVILNPGRGPLIEDEALVRALEGGRIAHATLDTFVEEPLDPDHPYWAHPRVTVTPHIASATRPDTASEAIAANISRCEQGEALHHVVDRELGY